MRPNKLYLNLDNTDVLLVQRPMMQELEHSQGCAASAGAGLQFGGPPGFFTALG